MQNATISFNNQSGILASCSKEELYNLSKANCSKKSYQDFVGQANYGQGLTVTGSSNVRATQGSLLIVKPAYNFNLPTFLSGGSLGQFGLQIVLMNHHLKM